MSDAAPSRRAARKAAINQKSGESRRSRDGAAGETDEEGDNGRGVAMMETKPGAGDDAKGNDNSNVDDNAAEGEDSVAESKNDGPGGNRRRNRGGNAGGGASNAEDDLEEGRDDMNNNNKGSFGPMKILEPVRQDPIKVMKAYQKKRVDRLAANALPEVHFVGQVVSGLGLLADSTEGATCRWKVDAGKAWELLGGDGLGQTQVAYCRHRDSEVIPFNHPLDLHFAQAGLQGWGAPRISFQVYRVDMYGRKLLQGYGFEHLPMTPGPHRLEVNLWRPTGTPEQELDSYMLGRTPALVSHEPLYETAWRERCRLVTMAAGKVYVDIMVVTRNTGKVGLDA
jgi:hypothetical protein